MAVAAVVGFAYGYSPRLRIGGVVVDQRRADVSLPRRLRMEWARSQLAALPFTPASLSGMRGADLFCGIGGWSWAMELLDCDVVAGFDFAPRALRHYAANFPGARALFQDLSLVAESAAALDSLGRLHVITVSSPCQGFSTRDRSDPRRWLIVRAAGIVAAMWRPPPLVVFENVLGMVEDRAHRRHPAEEYVEAMRVMGRAGYEVSEVVMRSSRLGVPQRRDRVFAICVRNGVRVDSGRLDAIGTQREAEVGDFFPGEAHYFVPRYSYEPSVYSNRRPMRCLRTPCAAYPAAAEHVRHARDFAPLSATRRFSLHDFLVVQGLPPWASHPITQTAGMGAIANTVVPVCGAAALGAACWPRSERGQAVAVRRSDVSEITRSATDRSRPASRDAGDDEGSGGGVPTDPVVGGDLQEKSLPHRPNCCPRCGDESWSPSVLSLRAIGCQIGGVNHAIGALAGTCWTTLDHRVEDLAVADDNEIRGLRLLVVGLAMPLPELAAAVALCRRLGRTTGAIGVIVARAERMEAACAMRWVRGAEQDVTERGLRLDAYGHADWVCEHLRAPPEDIDAWSFEGVDFTLAHARPATFAGLRRALRKQLNYALSVGERLDGTRRAVLDTATQRRGFGAPPLCAGGRMHAAGDPYFDIADRYQGLPPVGAQGVLDQIAFDAGEPLPTRVADSWEGEPAFDGQAADRARAAVPYAADLDAHAFDEYHVQSCEWCKAEIERRVHEQRMAEDAAAAASCSLEQRVARMAEDAAAAVSDSAEPRRHSRPPKPEKRPATKRVPREEAETRRVPGVPRPVRHSASCWFALFWLRVYFGILWVCEGAVSPSPRASRLEVMFPDGLLPDAERPDRDVPLHSSDISRGGEHAEAYRRGQAKWYAVPGLCVPCGDLPPEGEDLPEGWRPRWSIPQMVVLRDKDVYKSQFTGKPPKARCVCNVKQTNAYWRNGSFQYTAVEHFSGQLAPGDYIVVVDIQSFYLKLPFAVLMHCYYSFKDFFMKGREAWQSHTRLPFGAGLSPFYSCHTSAIAVDVLRGEGRAAAAEWRRYRTAFAKGGKGRMAAKRRAELRRPKSPEAFARWGVDCKSTVYVDDIALGGDEEAVGVARDRLVAILRRLGVPAKDKGGLLAASPAAGFPRA